MKPRFYSRQAIGISTVFLSAICGSILMAYNLKAAGKGKYAALVIILSFVWGGLMRTKLESFFPNPLIALLVFNSAAAVILASPVWDNFLGEYTEYEKRPAWKPVLIFVGICMALLALNFLSRL
jgi:hypothetical protein